MITELNTDNFDLETNSGLKLIEFYTTWCIYCKKQRIELQDLENSPVWVGIVDGDESPELVREFKINSYPAFVLLKDGNPIAHFSGLHTKSQLLNRLTKIITDNT